MHPRKVNIAEVRSRLSPLLDETESGAVVFDADGTLWSHDVGCMVFDEACDQGTFLPEAFEPLQRAALQQGLSAHSLTSANDVARCLQKGWHSGQTNEKLTAEMQVWAYVGVAERNFRAFTRESLKRGAHESTVHHEVLEVAAWVREQGHRALIVSASPLWVVEEATKMFGFSSGEIAAGVPNTRDESLERIIEPGLAAPLPYGPDKVTAGRALLDHSPWVAAFGDSSFDLDMMRAARLGVGIGGKVEMLNGLRDIPHAVHLSLADGPSLKKTTQDL